MIVGVLVTFLVVVLYLINMLRSTAAPSRSRG
jgi:hypothetical protein